MVPVLDLDALFDGFEPMETASLLLRPVQGSDAEAMYAILRDPQVIRYFGTPPMSGLGEAEARCVRLVNGFQERTKFRLALQFKETGQFVGTGGFWRFIPEHYRAEIGYELAPEQWGKGLMVEALQQILTRGFEVGLNSVEANLHPDNQASRRLLKKLGFRQEGLTRASFFEPHLGVFTDNAIYGLTKRDCAKGVQPPRRTNKRSQISVQRPGFF